jgi:hypothetical protein
MGTRDDAVDHLERPARHSLRRSARHRRRPPLLLAALVAGGLAAGVLGFHGVLPASAEQTSVLDAQQALATGDEGLEVLPMASITEAEAQARLQQVAASRAARARPRPPRARRPRRPPGPRPCCRSTAPG